VAAAVNARSAPPTNGRWVYTMDGNLNCEREEQLGSLVRLPHPGGGTAKGSRLRADGGGESRWECRDGRPPLSKVLGDLERQSRFARILRAVEVWGETLGMP
jgi:hypothetical protein